MYLFGKGVFIPHFQVKQVKYYNFLNLYCIKLSKILFITRPYVMFTYKRTTLALLVYYVIYCYLIDVKYIHTYIYRQVVT